ncbi:MAG: hypothetical protein JO131_05455 [Gammaproteobacteria bacterium]|nr:hypothetical protein [Gammaproteobacteria bacterium]
MRSAAYTYSTPAVCIDLDNTLLQGKESGECYLLDTALKWLMTAQASDLPCYIVTARSIYNLLFSTLDQGNNISLETTKTILFYSSFTFVLSEFKRLIDGGNPIQIPFICTLYDPFLKEKEQGLYYQTYEKINDYLIEKIDQLLKDDLLNSSEKNKKFLTLIANMRTILRPNSFHILDEECTDIPLDIIRILQTESKLSYNSIQDKDHQFLWVGLHSSCKHIIHVDDYALIYNNLNIRDLTDVNPFSPYPITSTHYLKSNNNKAQNLSVLVYCIPFNVSKYSLETLLRTMVEALNFPILKMIKEFEDLLLLRYCCLFRAIKQHEYPSVRWIVNLLHECCITYDQVIQLNSSVSHLEEKKDTSNSSLSTFMSKPSPEEKKSFPKIDPITDFKTSLQPLHFSSPILINKIKNLPLQELKKFVGAEKLHVIKKLQLLENLETVENSHIKKSALAPLLKL